MDQFDGVEPFTHVEVTQYATQDAVTVAVTASNVNDDPLARLTALVKSLLLLSNMWQEEVTRIQLEEELTHD